MNTTLNFKTLVILNYNNIEDNMYVAEFSPQLATLHPLTMHYTSPYIIRIIIIGSDVGK